MFNIVLFCTRVVINLLVICYSDFYIKIIRTIILTYNNQNDFFNIVMLAQRFHEFHNKIYGHII